MSAPRVRFAPSPTGYLHVGGARTALFNWLYARRTAGVFILRIEDTDAARSSEEMVTAILDGLSWLGLTHDEGPFFQSASRDEHVRKARVLLETGHAYRCFCSAEAIEGRRRAFEASGQVWAYDRLCLGVEPAEAARRASGEPFVVRFRVPEGMTGYDDLVHGPTQFSNVEIEDLVLLRSDGSPTYNLSCVSDDMDMRITHVIRGDDHISNTPKQILLYRALGAEPPRFGHLPLILGEDKKRLSKRHGAVSVMEYARSGYLPEALFNFLALLGWSPGGDREIMTRPEMVEAFSFEKVGARGAVFDHDKLAWMNGEYLRRRAPAELAELARPWFEKERLWQPELAGARAAWFHALLDLLKERSRMLGDLARDARPFLTEDFDYDADAAAKHLTPETAPRLDALREVLARLEPFHEAACEAALRGLAERLGVKAAALIHPARVALTGRAVSPGLFAVMSVMGREGVVRRLERATREIEAGAHGRK
ncbi:MAG: glutamate--tRNA ligase [Candidatus Polarisedimenticolia bacterium]